MYLGVKLITLYENFLFAFSHMLHTVADDLVVSTCMTCKHHEGFKVIPLNCIAHPCCARFFASFSARTSAHAHNITTFPSD